MNDNRIDLIAANNPRFHRRRAHFHKYHFGAGRAESKVRWVEATWVGLKGDA